MVMAVYYTQEKINRRIEEENAKEREPAERPTVATSTAAHPEKQRASKASVGPSQPVIRPNIFRSSGNQSNAVASGSGS